VDHNLAPSAHSAADHNLAPLEHSAVDHNLAPSAHSAHRPIVAPAEALLPNFAEAQALKHRQAQAHPTTKDRYDRKALHNSAFRRPEEARPALPQDIPAAAHPDIPAARPLAFHQQVDHLAAIPEAFPAPASSQAHHNPVARHNQARRQAAPTPTRIP